MNDHEVEKPTRLRVKISLARLASRHRPARAEGLLDLSGEPRREQPDVASAWWPEECTTMPDLDDANHADGAARVPATFSLDWPWWVAEVGDGLMGPAGSATFETDQLVLEFDRSTGQLLTVLFDASAEPDQWVRSVVPDAGKLTAPDETAGVSLTVVMPEETRMAMATAAILEAELRAVECDGDPGTAFHVVAHLELAAALAVLDAQLPGLVHPAEVLSRAAKLLEDAENASAVHDDLVDPTNAAVTVAFARLADAVSALGPEGERFRSIAHGQREPRFAERAPVAAGEASLGALRRPRHQPGSLPRVLVQADGTVVLPPSAVLAQQASGSVTWHHAEPPAVSISMHGLHRSGRAGVHMGPLWVRVFSAERIVAGGVLQESLEESVEIVLPAAAGEPATITAVDVWLNPYRYPDEESLVRTVHIGALASDALRLGRRASLMRREESRRVWAQCGRMWLAAGYLDRAALAFGLAGDPQAAIWARAKETTARLRAGHTPPRPTSLLWHPGAGDLRPKGSP